MYRVFELQEDETGLRLGSLETAFRTFAELATLAVSS